MSKPTDKKTGSDFSEFPTKDSRLPRNHDLIERIKDAADRLTKNKTSRGDIKILSRALRELVYAFKVFTPYRWYRKVTVFGSARTPSDNAGYQKAVEFGQKMADQGWFIVTGAASGIMEAGHVGAGRDHSMGLNIMLPFEQDANPIIAGDPKLVNMNYFFTRKLMFVKECDAVVCFPGGFGTLDEALEVLTLLQTGKRDIVPVIFIDAPDGNYWKSFHEFVMNILLRDKMISEEDLSLYMVTSDIDEAVSEVMNFYQVYHSMRYVKEQLVFRLHEELHWMLLRDINEEFGDILHSGEFVQCEALKEEKDEEELLELPRLKFHFNRRSHGRLRQLINCINRGSM